EGLYLALRTDAGIAAPASLRLSAPLRAFVAAGWLVEEQSRLRCTPQGWLRLDSLVADLTVQGSYPAA
ncbi:MAG: hypothetical protein ACREME_10855, partial [Gemmatimonadales bacterium]